MAVPKTMDNDVRDTEYCIGFSTAVTRAIDAIERQRTTVGSHERIGIFRVFGRDAGHTALYTAYVTSLRCCIPNTMSTCRSSSTSSWPTSATIQSNYALVILSEGAEWEGYKVKEYGEPDAYGHRKKMSVAEDLSSEIKAATGEETVVSDLTYELRSGTPGLRGPHGRHHLRGDGHGRHPGGQAGADDRGQPRPLRAEAYSRPRPRLAPGRGGDHVQYRALSPDLRPKAGATHLLTRA
jgi:hypothetical protein